MNECDEMAGACSQECENTQGSYICKCVDGWEREPDGRTCKKKDGKQSMQKITQRKEEYSTSHSTLYLGMTVEERDVHVLILSLLLQRRKTTLLYWFKNLIRCDLGFELYNICYISDIEPWLAFTNKYYIRELSLDGQYYKLIREGMQNAVAIDFDSVDNKLYYIDVQARQISRMNMNGTGVEKLVMLP